MVGNEMSKTPNLDDIPNIKTYLNEPSDYSCKWRGKMIHPYCDGCDCLGVSEACDSCFEYPNNKLKRNFSTSQ